MWQSSTCEISQVADVQCDQTGNRCNEAKSTHVEEAVKLHEGPGAHKIKLGRLVSILLHLVVVAVWNEVTRTYLEEVLPSEGYG